MARCACGSIAANPRGVFLMVPLLRDSASLSFRPSLVPSSIPLALLRSSNLFPRVFLSSAIIRLSCHDIRVDGPRFAQSSRKRWGWAKRGGHFPAILMRKRQAANPPEVGISPFLFKMWISSLLTCL
jgi:hypothetical protein